MDPTYRAGILREKAVKHMERLGHEGVTYGFLGPRVVKLISEAHLLRQCYGTMADVLEHSADQISALLESWMMKSENRPTEAISLGVPVLLSDGERILFGAPSGGRQGMGGRPMGHHSREDRQVGFSRMDRSAPQEHGQVAGSLC